MQNKNRMMVFKNKGKDQEVGETCYRSRASWETTFLAWRMSCIVEAKHVLELSQRAMPFFSCLYAGKLSSLFLVNVFLCSRLLSFYFSSILFFFFLLILPISSFALSLSFFLFSFYFIFFFIPYDLLLFFVICTVYTIYHSIMIILKYICNHYRSVLYSCTKLYYLYLK